MKAEGLINPKEKNKMAVRQKQKILDTVYKHFIDFELPVDIDYKAYVAIVGAKEAVHPISVKRSFKAWKYIIHSLKTKHKDFGVVPTVTAPTPPAPKPVKNSLNALSKTADKAEKEMNDDE